MSKYNKGIIIAEGKTKCIYQVVEDRGLVIVENKSTITAHDDPSLTREFATKAEYATTTTCRVFEFLRDCGIPVAYQEQLSPTSFVARKSDMISLEIVARRYAVGSYLKRHPDLITTDLKKPKRFHRLLVEFFLKTSGREYVIPIVHGVNQCGNVFSLPCDDPLIVDPMAKVWQFAHPKKPSWEEDSLIPSPVLGSECQEDLLKGLDITLLEKLVRQVTLALEKGWGLLGLDFIDVKIECDTLGVSDVIDGDSWRLWKNGEGYDKQLFRDKGEDVLSEVEARYGYIARMSERLQVPKQVLVVWRGSGKDVVPEVSEVGGLDIIKVSMSKHKNTVQVLSCLEQIMADYPQGGVIVAIVGRSNGLGPILATHSPWPVVSSPTTMGEFPEDIFSSLRMPSNVPMMTAWPSTNAIDAALTILGQTNPAAYVHMQMKREDQDDYID
ncbi:MAG: phosphoribosylaminoimidazolesuccinocarboxamide synthase [bacterium]